MRSSWSSFSILSNCYQRLSCDLHSFALRFLINFLCSSNFLFKLSTVVYCSLTKPPLFLCDSLQFCCFCPFIFRRGTGLTTLARSGSFLKGFSGLVHRTKKVPFPVKETAMFRQSCEEIVLPLQAHLIAGLLGDQLLWLISSIPDLQFNADFFPLWSEQNLSDHLLAHFSLHTKDKEKVPFCIVLQFSDRQLSASIESIKECPVSVWASTINFPYIYVTVSWCLSMYSNSFRMNALASP